MGGAADTVPARRAAILAGGAGSRMGAQKAAVELLGKPLAFYPAAAARAAGLEPFLVAKRDSELPGLGLPVVREPDEPRHPLAGVIAALEHFGEPVVVVACDMPLVPAPLLTALAAAAEPLALPAEPRLQPLLGRYSPALLPELRAGLAAGSSMTALVERLGGRRLAGSELRAYGDPAAYLASANTPEQLAALADQLSGTTSTRAL